MSDTFLLEMTRKAFEGIVEEALRACRSAEPLALANSPLAQSSLIDDKTPSLRDQATRATLRWAVDKLQPNDQTHSWTAYEWRAFNVLHFAYLEEHLTIEALSQRMLVHRQTIFRVRSKAIESVAAILQTELAEPRDAMGRRNVILAAQYAGVSAESQAVLRFLALFQQPIPLALLYEHLTPSSKDIHNLVLSQLITLDDGAVAVVRPMQTYLTALLTPAENMRWHSVAFRHFLEHRKFLVAAQHGRLGGLFVQSATLLLDHAQTILDNGDHTEIIALRDLLERFRLAELTPHLWTQLNILSGRIHQFLGGLDAAIARYRTALMAEDAHVKALACLHLATVLRKQDFDESLAYYDFGIRTAKPDDPLLVRLYIDSCWIYLQERQQLDEAAQRLALAQQLLQPDDKENAARLFNALAALAAKNHAAEQAVEFSWQAWMAASALQDAERMMQTAHNLGLAYAELVGEPKKGLRYLQRALNLAERTGNRPMIGLCHTSIGSCHYWLEHFDEAAAHYRQAHTLFGEIEDQNGLAHACFNLAEVLQNADYYQQGIALAQQLGDAQLEAEFEQLAERYPQLKPMPHTLSARQQQALAWLHQNGTLTNRTYCEVCAVSRKTAHRDLTDLVEKKAIVPIGKGRGRYYVFASSH